MQLGGNYIVYENRRTRRVVIHQVGCAHVAKRGGVSGTCPPNSWYCGPFGTTKQAQLKINTDRGDWTQDICGTCDAV